MQISPSPLVCASWLSFNTSLFFFFPFFFFPLFPSPISRERRRGEREHLKKKSAEKDTGVTLQKSNPNKPSQGIRSTAALGRGARPLGACFARKRKQKGIWCWGCVQGEGAGACLVAKPLWSPWLSVPFASSRFLKVMQSESSSQSCLGATGGCS